MKWSKELKARSGLVPEPLPKYQLGTQQPTEQDSLNLLKNNKIIDKMISDGGFTVMESGASDSDRNGVSDLYSQSNLDNEGYAQGASGLQDALDYEKLGDRSTSPSVRKGNLVGSKDWWHGGGDDSQFPITYRHRYIEPQSEVEMEQETSGFFQPNNFVHSYRYDDLAITPWKYLSHEQQNDRVKKFGFNGTPYDNHFDFNNRRRNRSEPEPIPGSPEAFQKAMDQAMETAKAYDEKKAAEKAKNANTPVKPQEVVQQPQKEPEVLRPSITKIVKDSSGNIISQEEGISQKEAGRVFNQKTKSWEKPKLQNGGYLPKYQLGTPVDGGGAIDNTSVNMPRQLTSEDIEPLPELEPWAGARFRTEQRNSAEGQELHEGLSGVEKISNFISDLGTEFAYAPRTMFTLSPPTIEEKRANRTTRSGTGDAGANRVLSMMEGATYGMGAELMGGTMSGAVNKIAGKQPQSLGLKMPVKGEPYIPTKTSELNWGKWNKEIPNNSALMDEYIAIEEAAKANGTWMKNADGSAFKGTPEQFVQQQSKNFKSSFPDGAHEVFRGTGSNRAEKGQDIFTTPDKALADSYALQNKEIIKHEGGKLGGVNELYVKKSGNSADLDLSGQVWSDLDLTGGRGMNFEYNLKHQKLTLAKRTESLKKLEASGLKGDEFGWSSLDLKNSIALTKEHIDQLERMIAEPTPVKTATEARLKSHFKGERPSTDVVLRYMMDEGIDNVNLRNIHDGGFGSVRMVNNRPGNFIKSTFGNNGRFDMNDPNIFKSVTGAAVGSEIIKNNSWLYNDTFLND